MHLPKQSPWRSVTNFSGVPLLALLVIACLGAPGHGLDLGSLDVWLSAGTPLVIAAIGQTQIVLAGGQGLAAGSTALFVNSMVVAYAGETPTSVFLWCAIGVLTGAAIGACNGALVGFLRLPSTAVTLATGAIAGSATMLLADLAVSAPHAHGLISGNSPASFVTPGAIVAILLIVALLLDSSALGRRFRAVGRGGWGAVDRRSGSVVMLSYTIAGLAYGVSGVLGAAETGAVDPISGGVPLVEIYAAVILGGSVPYVRQGSTLGAAIGALGIGGLTFVVSLLGWPEYVTPVCVALLLLVGLWRAGAGIPRHAAPEPPDSPVMRVPLAYIVLPVAFTILLATGLGRALVHLDPAVIAVAGILAVAQANVVITGHFDLSLPAITAASGALCVALSRGSDTALSWLVPLLLALGGAIGFANGASALILRSSRVLATLASMHLLETAAMTVAIAFPFGFAPPKLMAFADPTTPSQAAAFYAAAGAIFGGGLFPIAVLPAYRRLRGEVGQSSPAVAQRAAPFLHGVAGFIAAAAGIILTGYSGKAPGGGDPFTLSSLLAVEMAGFTIGRRGGHPWMLILSVPVVLAIDVLVTGNGFGPSAGVALTAALLLASILTNGVATLVLANRRRVRSLVAAEAPDR